MSTVEHRLVTCLQVRGNLGKSTVLGALAQYCEQRNVPWRGYDLDGDHRSFSRLFPETVSLRELSEEPEGDIIKIARGCTEVPMTIVDPRAHIADKVFRGLEIIKFTENFAIEGGRISVLLFPGDDLELLTDIDALVTRLGDSVDYIVVLNPARQPRYRMFQGSELERDLVQMGAVTLEVPTLLAVARNHLAALEVELGRAVTHVEAAANRELALDGMVRMVVEDWVKMLFRRFDCVAGNFLPTAYAAKIVSVDTAPHRDAPSPKRGAKNNYLNL